MKKKIKRFVPTLLVMLILANTMAYAGNQLYSFDLPTGAARYTDVITKDTSNYRKISFKTLASIACSLATITC